MPFTLSQWAAFTLAEWLAFVLNDAVINPTTYTYDAVGNRQQAISPSGTTTYQYDVANQLTTSLDASGNLTTYTYDGAGNLTQTNASGLTTNNTFDSLNRLVLVQPAAGGDVTFLYDPDGRRIQKESSTEMCGSFTTERNCWSKTTARTRRRRSTRKATRQRRLRQPGQPVRRGQSSSYQFGFDALGSTGALIDSSGAAADRWEYSAFGLQNSAPMGEPTRLTYGGQKGYQFDLELDLYYCRNRYYDPVTGRWVNQDRRSTMRSIPTAMWGIIRSTHSIRAG